MMPACLFFPAPSLCHGALSKNVPTSAGSLRARRHLGIGNVINAKLRRHELVYQVAEEERRLARPLFRCRTIRVKAAPPFDLIARHVCPADLLRVFQDAGLDGFVFSGGGHSSTGHSLRYNCDLGL